jgi:hypothetical protein
MYQIISSLLNDILDVSEIDASTTRVVLNGAQYIAYIKSNGEFTM